MSSDDCNVRDGGNVIRPADEHFVHELLQLGQRLRGLQFLVYNGID